MKHLKEKFYVIRVIRTGNNVIYAGAYRSELNEGTNRETNIFGGTLKDIQALMSELMGGKVILLSMIQVGTDHTRTKVDLESMNWEEGINDIPCTELLWERV